MHSVSLQPVILCGGDGTRLWPASRKAMPKQFMPLHGTTLFKQTLHRIHALSACTSPLILCNEEHRFLAAVQMQEVQAEVETAHAHMRTSPILLEPVGKNTAPAIALAAFELLEENPIMLVLPSDHAIADPKGLETAIQQGVNAAQQGYLVTFGIVPTAPETGYGYILAGSAIDAGASAIDSFIEKPNYEKAASFVAAGNYYWNSGMFMFTAKAFLEELKLYSPEIYTACHKAHASRKADLDFLRFDVDAFTACPANSVDYAVMEHTKKAAVVPLHAHWSDLGSWNSLHAISEKDEKGNSFMGDVLAVDCTGSFVLSQSRLVAAIGMDNTVIVETADAIVVAPKDKSQEVKTLVGMLKQQKRAETETHARVYRPWGSYEALTLGGRFQVKRIIVQPGQRLSLQKHYHRAEHWVVVHGVALVTVGDAERLLTEDQSTYIPVGVVHRLENPGKFPLEIIEIQTGGYLGEDDIVRLEDVYGR